ncbi:MAG: hypothetical protein M3O70_11755 [Actinomycetota bacterium]|nr:hypothetical protein [Actinomycetota bacterium]
MVRVRVSLDSVACRDTEDVTGADHFYLAGVVTDGETVKEVLTRPLKINNGQTISFGEGGGTIFHVDAPTDRILKVTFVGFDQDAGSDWKRIEGGVKQATDAVAAVLRAIPNPYTVTAAELLPVVRQGIGAVMQMDIDDELGQHVADFPLWGLPQPNGGPIGLSQFVPLKGGSGWWSSWNYTVNYRVLLG